MKRSNLKLGVLLAFAIAVGTLASWHFRRPNLPPDNFGIAHRGPTKSIVIYTTASEDSPAQEKTVEVPTWITSNEQNVVAGRHIAFQIYLEPANSSNRKLFDKIFPTIGGKGFSIHKPWVSEKTLFITTGKYPHVEAYSFLRDNGANVIVRATFWSKTADTHTSIVELVADVLDSYKA
ncbi:MAG TPA: hypothetical protein VGL56_05290 [Fimbriimonadaceae bacterium]|jgi:hypothetical protein